MLRLYYNYYYYYYYIIFFSLRFFFLSFFPSYASICVFLLVLRGSRAKEKVCKLFPLIKFFLGGDWVNDYSFNSM